jgi:outer membrane lipoprotein-sorting protein
MKTIKLNLGILIIALISALGVSNLYAQSADDIAKKVYNRTTAKDGESDMTMKLINAKGKTRTRLIYQFFKDYGTIEKKTMFFKSPADVKNTAFMNWTYDEDKDDDQWLYLPALKKVKRISSSSKDNEFMGSDFTYEDMEKRNPNKDNHKLLRTVKYKNETCYVIESTPKEEGQYSKRIAWIVKGKWIPLKIEFYDEDEELLKVLSITEYKKIKDYWIIVNQEMKNVQKNHKTVISLTNVSVDKGLSEGKFSQREMERGL